MPCKYLTINVFGTTTTASGYNLRPSLGTMTRLAMWIYHQLLSLHRHACPALAAGAWCGDGAIIFNVARIAHSRRQEPGISLRICGQIVPA